MVTIRMILNVIALPITHGIDHRATIFSRSLAARWGLKAPQRHGLANSMAAFSIVIFFFLISSTIFLTR